MRKPMLCLDFDGVIHSYSSGWQGPRVIPDEPVYGAIPAIIEYLDHFTVAIYSARSGQFGGRRAMKRWLRKHIIQWLREEKEKGFLALHRACDVEMRFVGVHMEPPDIVERDTARAVVRAIQWPKKKPPAMVGLDDRVLTFQGTFPSVIKLGEFKPWNRRGG